MFRKKPHTYFVTLEKLNRESSNFIQELQVLYNMQGVATNSFILFPFCKNSLLCLEDKLMIPCRGNMYFSLSCLPATPSSPSYSLEGLFELTRRPSQGLDWPCALLLELQRNKANIGCVALGAEVPGHFKNN